MRRKHILELESTQIGLGKKKKSQLCKWKHKHFESQLQEGKKHFKLKFGSKG